MFHVRLFSKKEIAKDTYQVTFTTPKGFSFQAGQYITIFLGKENRDFTICSDAQDKAHFSLVTKKGKSGFKKKFLALPIGQKITCNKPAGGFVFTNTKDVVFLAGGIGITPFYSMLSSNSNTRIPVALLVSFSKKEDMIFFDELQKLQQKNRNIHAIYTLTNDAWEGETGRISEKIIKKYVPHFNEKEFMIAGSEKFAQDMEALMLQMKVPQESIRLDIFTGY